MKYESWLTAFYAVLLHLYPSHIRVEFQQEMLLVFDQARGAAERQGGVALARMMLEEMAALPVVLARAYREAALGVIHKLLLENSSMFNGESESWRLAMNGRGFSPLNKGQALLAGLPLVLIGFGIATGGLIYDGTVSFPLTWTALLPLLAPLGPGILLGVVSIWALLRGLPDWSISWLGSFLMGAALFAQVMMEEMIDEGTIALSPALELLLPLAMLLAGLAVLVMIARRGWARAGLFTAAAAGLFGLSLLQAVMAAPFTRTDLAVLAAPVGLVLGWLIFLYTRNSNQARGIVLLGVAALNTCLVFLANTATRDRLNDMGRASPLVPLLVMITVVLVSGPLLGLLVTGRRTS